MLLGTSSSSTETQDAPSDSLHKTPLTMFFVLLTFDNKPAKLAPCHHVLPLCLRLFPHSQIAYSCSFTEIPDSLQPTYSSKCSSKMNPFCFFQIHVQRVSLVTKESSSAVALNSRTTFALSSMFGQLLVDTRSRVWLSATGVCILNTSCTRPTFSLLALHVSLVIKFRSQPCHTPDKFGNLLERGFFPTSHTIIPSTEIRAQRHPVLFRCLLLSAHIGMFLVSLVHLSSLSLSLFPMFAVHMKNALQTRSTRTCFATASWLLPFVLHPHPHRPWLPHQPLHSKPNVCSFFLGAQPSRSEKSQGQNS